MQEHTHTPSIPSGAKAPLEPAAPRPGRSTTELHPVLNRNLFFVKEHVGIFKAANNYDILDPETKQVILHCREERLHWMTKLLRFTDYKRMTPFHVEIKTPQNEMVVQVKRGISIFLSKVDVLNGRDMRLGGFKQKFFSIGGAFDVLGLNDQVLCTLKGSWKGFEYSFQKERREIAKVSKKWMGIGKELFTSADNYILQINDTVPANDPVSALILGAVVCIDMVLKE